MRLIGKLLALPFMLVTGILYLVCKFLVVLSGAVLGILSGIIFLAALSLITILLATGLGPVSVKPGTTANILLAGRIGSPALFLQL